MENQNIRIHLKAYDNKILDLSTEEIVKGLCLVLGRQRVQLF